MNGYRPAAILPFTTVGLAARHYAFVLPSGAEARLPCVQVQGPDSAGAWGAIRGQDAVLHEGRFATNVAALLAQWPGAAALVGQLMPNGKPRYFLSAAFRNTEQRTEAVAAAVARLQSRNAHLLRWNEGIPLSTEIISECVQDILTVVVGEARLVMGAPPNRSHFERRVLHPVKFWAALVMLRCNIPIALVEMNCFEERHRTSPASLLNHHERLLHDSDSIVRHALEWIPAIGPTEFFRAMIRILPRRSREILNTRDVDQAIRLMEGACLLHRTRQAAQQAGDALADLPITIGIEFLAATQPSRDLGTQIASEGDILATIYAACRKDRVRVTKGVVRARSFDFKKFGRDTIRTALMAFDSFRYRDTTVLLLRWEMGGTVQMSVHQTGGESRPPLVVPVRRAHNAKTIFDAEADGLAMVAEALGLAQVEQVRQLMHPDAGYERVYLATFTDRLGHTARCTATPTHPEGSEGAETRFQGYDCLIVGERGREMHNTWIVDYRSVEQALRIFRLQLGSTSPPFALRRRDRQVAVHLSNIGGSVRMAPVDYPFSLLQLPPLRREALETGIVETIVKPLAAAGFVGTTRELPIGSQFAATLPLEINGILTIGPFLRLMRAYLGAATKISAVLNPRGVRKGYLTYIPPHLAQLLADPEYASDPTDPTQILAVIADCLLELGVTECYELNVRNYLLALAHRVYEATLAKTTHGVAVLTAKDWHGRTHQFFLRALKGDYSPILIHTTGFGIVAQWGVPGPPVKTTGLKWEWLTPTPLPTVQLRLPNTMYRIRPDGAYAISGEATRWVAEWWSEFCALSTAAIFSP